MYTCKRCNCNVLERFGSGVFCSRTCANSRAWTDEDKKKKSDSAKSSTKVQTALRKWRPKKIPRILQKCPICSRDFETTLTQQKIYCSRKCSYKNPNLGGYRQGSERGKSGWYKGIYCGSTWELAFVVWAIDHNLPIARCTQIFEYVFEGETKRYHPDFVINDHIIEIKGFETPKTHAKRLQTPQVITFFGGDLQHVFQYVKLTYGFDFTKLYEGNPHNQKKNACKVCNAPCRRFFCSRSCSMKGNHYNNFKVTLVGVDPTPPA